MKQIFYSFLVLSVLLIQPKVLMGQVEKREPFPFEIRNSMGLPDSEIYVAILGEDFSGVPGVGNQHVWVDCKTGNQYPMNKSYNTVKGPVYVTVDGVTMPARNDHEGNRNPGMQALYADIFTKLSDIPNRTVPLNVIQGCRVYISAGEQLYFYFHGPGPSAPKGYTAPSPTDPTDPNQGIMHEVIELTYDKWGYFANTTRVDAYKFPIGMEVFAKDTTFINPLLPRPALIDPSNIQSIGLYKKVGEKKSHEYIVDEWKKHTAKYPAFAGCLDEKTGEISQPTKTAAFADGTVGTMPTPGPYVNYMQPYIDAIWAKYRNEDLHFFTGDAGYFKGRINGDVLTVTSTSSAGGPFYGRSGTIAGKPTTQMILEGKGLLDNVVNDRTVDLMIQAQFCAAVTRHVVDVTTPNVGLQYWNDPSKYYLTEPANMYAAFWHKENISVDGRSYGFAYDDVWDQSSSAPVNHPERVIVTFGGYSYALSANAGPDKTINYPSQKSIQLDGTGSSSADDDPISYSWVQKSTSPIASITNANTATPTVTFNTTGFYTFTLTVTVGTLVEKDDVTITVVDETQSAPYVYAGADRSINMAQTQVVLTGEATDLDGTIESYSWSQVSGPNQSALTGANSTKLTASNLIVGKYIFRLSATDNDGLTGQDEVAVVVIGGGGCVGGPDNGDYTYELSGDDTNPTLTFFPARNGVGSSIVILNIRGAGYPAAANTPYQLTANKGEALNFYYTYNVPEGGERNTSTTPHSETVGSCGSSNMFPEVSAGGNINVNLSVTTSVTLSGSGNDLEDGNNVSFNWSQINGPNTATLNGKSTNKLTIIGMIPGVYKFQLTVTDSQGQSSSDVAYVFVDLSSNSEYSKGEEKIYIYPNPVVDIINIQLPHKHDFFSVNVFNSNGMNINSEMISEDNIEINISSNPSGFYFIRLMGENSTKSIKVIKK